MPEVHARLSASSSARWIACPPSVKLSEGLREQPSEYAEEGTLAHSLAEILLKHRYDQISDYEYANGLDELMENDLYSEEMWDAINVYVSQVCEIVDALEGDAQIFFEQRLDFSEYVPNGFGTGDVVIIEDGKVYVIDLKFGKGVRVSAENNSQLRLYGLGAYLLFCDLYDIDQVQTIIIQPRLDHISDETINIDELLRWGEEVVKPRAAMAEKGEGELCVGDHCRFCRAYAVCRAQKDYQMQIARHEFADPDRLEPEEIADVLDRAADLTRWTNAVSAYALAETLAGNLELPGYKLVEGRSTRTYTDEAEVAKTLQKEGYTDIYKPLELLGITAMEKTLGKKAFSEVLGDLVHKPPGKPTLVKTTDKRPELNSLEEAKKLF